MIEQGLVIYYAVSIVYIVIRLRWGVHDPMFTIMLLFFLPFLGLFLSLLQIIARRGNSASSQRFNDLRDGYDAHENRIFERVDIAKGVNLVPLEEALVVNDLKTRRRLLLDLLKEDMDESILPLLEQAINNDDTETSHYAVTAVVEIKRKLLISIQHWAVKYESNKNDQAIILQYAEVMKQYISSGLMDKRMKLTYRLTYSKLLDQLLASEAKSEVLFSEKIKNEHEIGRFDEAMRWSILFLESYPNDENAYISALNLYYTLKMNDSFFETLEEFKKSKIRVSNSALNTIRYWSRKGA